MTRYGFKVEKQSCSLASPRIGNLKMFGIPITNEAAGALFRPGVGVGKSMWPHKSMTAPGNSKSPAKPRISPKWPNIKIRYSHVETLHRPGDAPEALDGPGTTKIK